MKKRLFSLLIILALLLTILPPTLAVNDKPLIIILPGIMGSELKSADRLVWPPVDLDLVSIVDSIDLTAFDIGVFLLPIKTNLEKLKYVDGKPSVPLTVVQNYGTFATYQRLAEQLKSDGFDAVVYCYDWRQSNSDSANQLADFISQYSGRKITLLGHSMGGLVISEYIKAHPTNNNIERVITLGTPYLGSQKAVTVLNTGNIFGDYFPAAVASLLGPTIADVAATLPSMKELEPRDSFSLPSTVTTPWYVFYGTSSSDGKSDGTVSVASATNDGKFTNAYAVKDTHDGLVYNEYVIATVEQIISSAPAFLAAPTYSEIIIGKKSIQINAYSVSDGNSQAVYVKLRDVAAALSDSFNIEYANGKVNLISGKSYTPVGGELVIEQIAEPTIKFSADSFTLNGIPISLPSYKINNSNYVNLSDLSAALSITINSTNAKM